MEPKHKKGSDVEEGKTDVRLNQRKNMTEIMEGNRTLAEYMGGVYETHPVLGKGYSFLYTADAIKQSLTPSPENPGGEK